MLIIFTPRYCSVDIYNFFHAALPTEGVLSLEDLHTIVRNVWLSRFDFELEEEQAARRKGRPKSVKEQKIEDLKVREVELYRTGMGGILFLIPTKRPLTLIFIYYRDN